MKMSDTEELQLVVEEVPESARYKCEVCNMDFYKPYQTPYQNARALEGHLKRQSHRHNVERRKMGLEPEKLYAITNVGKQLGELVERLGSRLEEQYKARYETRLKLAEEQHKELTERVVTLKAETVELRKRWRAGKSCIAFLNTRLRDVFKRIRAGKLAAAEGPKCHVLGTYCDVLGAPV